jgi:type IV pilus assembly protein PilB
MEAIDHYYGASHALELKKVMENIAATEETDLTVMEEEDGMVENLQELEASTEDAPVVKLVNLMFSDALKRKASDIHIEPYEKTFRVRFRIDGILHEVMNPPLKLKDAITSRLKILARLDISEKRLPQDGRIKMKMKIGGKMKEVDVRVSVIPALYGEKVVMRLLDKDYLMLDMTKLGFEPESLARFEKAIQRPYGMVLVTGPTGSGKTNTLYSAISRINTTDVNITTAEDPVEYNVPGVNQVQMKDQIGLNFAAALRSYLRQDPNIILVGEIRDFETAEIAIKASLTGHLVFSTLHTNDAPSTINRLMNMGIEPFLVSTSVHLIVAQRLVRRICAGCKDEHKVPPQTLIDIGFDPEEVSRIRIFKGKGCPDCGMSGYKGRIALYEVMEVGDSVKEMILMGASALEIKKQAIEDGMISLRGSGLRKLRDGVTTLEEVLRETVH